jgi:uncharacterized membrane protein (DUF485 family)
MLSQLLAPPVEYLRYPFPDSWFWSPLIERQAVTLALCFAVLLFVLRFVLTWAVYRPLAVSFGVVKRSFQLKLVRFVVAVVIV